MATFSYKALLRELSEARVNCIIIGGAAAVLHGSTMLTNDLDIIPDRSPETWIASKPCCGN